MKKIIFITCTVLVLIFVCIVFMFNLFGFSSESPQLVSQNVIIFSESMTEYNYSEITNLLSKGTTIDELSNQFDIRYYKYDLVMGFYTVIKTDRGLLMLLFDYGLTFNSYIILNVNTNTSAHDKLTILQTGTSVKNVMKVDQCGNYPFLYAGNSEYPKISYHCFSNGNGYVIRYDDNYCVSKIFEFTI